MPKPTPTHPTRQQEVSAWVKQLEHGDNRFSTREKFLHFLELAYVALAKRTAPDEERADALEKRYGRIEAMYDSPKYVREFYGDLMGAAILAVSAGGIDFLGQIAAQTYALADELGQFFSPYEVCKMMAMITFDQMDEVIARDGYITLQEPACGAGAMVLAYADVLQEHGYTPAHHMLVHATDISTTAYMMGYLQLAWRGIPSLVVRGNSLSMEVFEMAWTPVSALFFKRHGHLNFHKPTVLSHQISLFDMEGAAD